MKFADVLLRSWEKPGPLTILLFPLALIYGEIIFLRRLFYRLGWLSTYTAPVPVIVVGNLTVGGSGKTPVVIALVEQLKKNGFKPGVVSRGYGGKIGPEPLLVSADSDVRVSGDEPLLIAKRTNVPVMVHPKRTAAAKKLVEENGVDIILSDDGLQHYALNRDVEICIDDDTTRFNNRHLLPAGPYREPRSRLKRVDIHLYHRHQDSQSKQPEFHLRAGKPESLKRLKIGYKLGDELPYFDRSLDLHAVAGIGNPQRFFDTCRASGLKILEHAFPDHYFFQQEDLAFSPVIMTEKDALKCLAFDRHDLWYLPVNAVFNKLFWQQFEQVIDALNESSQR